MMASEPHRPRSGPLAVIVIATIIGVCTALFVSQMHIHQAELLRNLDSADSDTVQASLIVLKNRRDPAGIDKAIHLLKSSDASTWLDAALYLGAMGRPEAKPYLSKALGFASADQRTEIETDLDKLGGSVTQP
jgi:HEAT repeat protein